MIINELLTPVIALAIARYLSSLHLPDSSVESNNAHSREDRLIIARILITDLRDRF